MSFQSLWEVGESSLCGRVGSPVSMGGQGVIPVSVGWWGVQSLWKGGESSFYGRMGSPVL